MCLESWLSGQCYVAHIAPLSFSFECMIADLIREAGAMVMAQPSASMKKHTKV